MQSGTHKKSWALAIGLFFIGLILGAAVVSSSLGQTRTSNAVTVTANTAIGGTVASSGKQATTLKVLATFFPLQDWAANVGGTKANVSLLVPVGEDVHDFEPTPAAIQAIATADLLILNGVDLEPWANETIKAAANPHLIVVDCSVGVNLIKLPPQFQQEGRVLDPHIWNDPIDAITMVRDIQAGYIKADPANAAYYSVNADVYVKKLQVLNQEFVDLATSKDLATRDFITFHTAWAYFAMRYNLNQIGVFGPFEEDPTPADISRVVFEINQNKLCYVGYESLENPAIPQAIAQQTHATLIPMNPNEGLTEQQSGVGMSYLSMMQIMLFVMTLALTHSGC